MVHKHADTQVTPPTVQGLIPSFLCSLFTVVFFLLHRNNKLVCSEVLKRLGRSRSAVQARRHARSALGSHGSLPFCRAHDSGIVRRTSSRIRQVPALSVQDDISRGGVRKRRAPRSPKDVRRCRTSSVRATYCWITMAVSGRTHV